MSDKGELLVAYSFEDGVEAYRHLIAASKARQALKRNNTFSSAAYDEVQERYDTARSVVDAIAVQCDNATLASMGKEAIQRDNGEVLVEEVEQWLQMKTEEQHDEAER